MDAPQPRHRSSVRRLWRIGGALAAVVMVFFATTQVVVALAHEEELIEREFPADDIRVLDVDSEAGSVEIVGADTDVIEMTADVSHGLRRTGYGWEENGDRLEVHSSCPVMFSDFCRVTFTFTVPRELALEINTNASIRVDSIDGDANLSASDGRVEVSDMSGDLIIDSDASRVTGTQLSSRDVEASSDAGRVELRFSAPPDIVIADSDAASVEIVVPDREPPDAYRVVTDTDDGSEEVGVVNDPNATRIITATTDAGSVDVRYGPA
jgi:hypothetical protein